MLQETGRYTGVDTYTQAGRQASPPKRGVPVTPVAEEEAQHLHGGNSIQWSRTGSESPGNSVPQGSSSFTPSRKKLPEAGDKGPQCSREIKQFFLDIRT